jgi:hypothetical protein
MLRSTGTTPGSRLAIPRYELGSKRRQILPLVGGGGGSSTCNISRGSGRTCALRGGPYSPIRRRRHSTRWHDSDAGRTTSRATRMRFAGTGNLTPQCPSGPASSSACFPSFVGAEQGGALQVRPVAGPPGRRPACAGLSGAPARGPVQGR